MPLARDAGVDPGTLFLVATPIGDLEDLSPRARRVLGDVDLVAAEDTRVAATLFRRLGIRSPRSLSVHDHNEAQRAATVVAALDQGRDVALISDAGTPLLSDPGYRVVTAVVAAGHRIVPVPGPSAMLAALTASGLPTDRFVFLGFLPRQAGKRRAALDAVSDERATLVLYEAPHRILATLTSVREAMGERATCLAISLTKRWERFHRGTVSQVHDAMADDEERIGEMTLVIAGAPDADAAMDPQAAVVIRGLVARGVSPGVVRDAVAPAFSLPRRAVYQAALEAAEE